MTWKNPKYDRVLIFGDSWGRGAWTKSDGSFIDNGDNYFEEKLLEYFKTSKNYSVGGSSNANTIITMNEALRGENAQTLKDPKTCILVIQTEPMRTVIPGLNFDLPSDYTHVFKNVDFKTFNETLINLFYFNLNEIGRKFRTKIHLVGGCSDVDMKLVKAYPYISVACISFYQLLKEPGYVPNIFSVTLDVSKAMSKFTRNNNEVTEQIQIKQGLQSNYQGSMFGYKMDNHPSRKGIDHWTYYILKSLR